MELPAIRLASPRPPASGGCATNRCGTARAAPGQLPASIQTRIQDHPCYSVEAHRQFARMHVAVAPGCNIQCNYCNRKYDCTNESRPGVVSEVLTPEQAARKVLAVGAAIPQLAVVGIAGPGDPLANPRRTFETFRLIRAQAPDLRLCLSTNGLQVERHLDDILAAGIDHVTITINAVDAAIAARIYPWIFWERRRIHGIDGARILIERQQRALTRLAAHGILVKINSVLIPGINDAHLPEVSRFVQSQGAFLHNVMPLISAPEHGTRFGLDGQREPTPAELRAVQEACAGDMRIMRHCQQCRADAVGMLGEERGGEFTLDRIAALTLDPEAARQRRREVHAALLAAPPPLRQAA